QIDNERFSAKVGDEMMSGIALHRMNQKDIESLDPKAPLRPCFVRIEIASSQVADMHKGRKQSPSFPSCRAVALLSLEVEVPKRNPPLLDNIFLSDLQAEAALPAWIEMLEGSLSIRIRDGRNIMLGFQGLVKIIDARL